MAYILSIDTSTKVCSVAIHKAGELIGQQSYHIQKSHSSLLPEIIDQIAVNCELTLQEIGAVAISEGPGSYTGLRIGTATAKGLAFSLGVPLIAINSLDTMCAQVFKMDSTALYCPMIDARRMEVYCKLVTGTGEELWETRALVVDETVFDSLPGRPVVMFGNGSDKLKSIFKTDDYVFINDIHPSATFMGELAAAKYDQGDFVDLAYFEPEYLKEFQTAAPVRKS